MSLMRVQVPRIIELADLIAKDIRERNLKPGDPYQGTMETAEMLGVGTTAANRAPRCISRIASTCRRRPMMPGAPRSAR